MTIPIVQCLSDVEYFITYVYCTTADIFSYLENYWHKDIGTRIHCSLALVDPACNI